MNVNLDRLRPAVLHSARPVPPPQPGQNANLDGARHALAKPITGDEGDFVASCPEAKEAARRAWIVR